MSMLQHSTRAWGSPSRYIQGRYELENMKTHTEVYGRRVFFLIDVFFFADYKKRFEALYAGSDSQIQCEQFGGQCTEEEILRCTGLAKALNPTWWWASAAARPWTPPRPWPTTTTRR